jgi:SPP1 family predicted phage head-tail adaptor
VSAGQLRERIAFEYRDTIDDGYGNQVSGPWREGCQVAARIKPLRGSESVQAARLAGRQPVTITVRVCHDTLSVTTDWRARDVRTERLYNIRSIVNSDEMRRYLDMECEAGVAP